VAYGFYALAIMLALVNLFILAVSRRLKRKAEAALVHDEAG
jgi:hypothetical protein